MFKTFKMGLQSDKNNRASLETAYEVLENVVKIQPDLAPEITKTILAKTVTNINRTETMIALSGCMRRCKPEDFADCLAKDENVAQKMQILQAAQRMRNSTIDDIKYACDSYPVSKLAEEPILFSQQQRCMNILLSQLGKENGENKNSHLEYRKAPEQDKLYQANKDWLLAASFKSAQTFGCNFPSYMRQTEKYLSTHDAVYWLPEQLTKDKKESFSSFVCRNLIYTDGSGKKQYRPLAEMELIAKNWQYLKPEQEKQKYKDILASCQSRKYEEQECDKFAVEAAKWGVRNSQYKDLESVYMAG
ncbi:MAG: hypothetical protein Q4D80_04780 [Pseudomonadota bacterium]|nr:hypothetical protein [Pseudomonadota bacterium]